MVCLELSLVFGWIILSWVVDKTRDLQTFSPTKNNLKTIYTNTLPHFPSPRNVIWPLSLQGLAALSTSPLPVMLYDLSLQGPAALSTSPLPRMISVSAGPSCRGRNRLVRTQSDRGLSCRNASNSLNKNPRRHRKVCTSVSQSAHHS